MKNAIRIILSATVVMLAACSTPTMITGSWRKPNATANNYRNVFVAAITSNVPLKQEIESGLQQLLQERGLAVETSTNIFPPTFNTQTGQQHELVLGKIQSTGADAILTVALLKQETESRYVPGAGGPWFPGRYGYYGRFWSYYNNWYPSIYSPGYYDQTKVYYLETNLYDAKTEDLIWAAQSKTYDPTNVESFLKGYLKSVREQMIKDGLITNSQTMAQANR